MKKQLLSIATLILSFVFVSGLNAQSATDEAAVLKMWDDVWQTYESGNDAQMWAFYAPNACEVYPDGSMLCGVETMKAGYEAFKGMLDGKPSWTFTKPTVRFIEPTVAFLSADITSDIKLKGGQQIGGKAKFVTVVHKVNGRWLIEFDSQTPVLQMDGQ